jgi:hypothetical protein
MGVLFSAALSESKETFIYFTPSLNRKFNIYESYLGKYPQSSYWVDTWGGYFDTPVSNQVELFIGGNYLQRVYSLSDCQNTENSIYDPETAGTVYINVPKHPWLYDANRVNYRETRNFLSAPKNPSNPSDDVFDGEHWPVRLETPKLPIKLSDVINGLTKYSTFDFTLWNDDGYFDNIETTNYFNAPSYIRKTWKENPAASDFIPIRYGMVETIKVNEKTMTITCADLFRSLEEPVCKLVKDVFPPAVENINEKVPIVYGQVTIPLIKINENQYIACENLTGAAALFDKDGNLIPSSSWTYNLTTKIITTSVENVKYLSVAGNTADKTIGGIIKDVIISRTKLSYTPSFFDLNETDYYVSNSPQINIAFTDGTVRDAIGKALKSDMAFLIQKNDGRFTIREWGKTYNSFDIDSWTITKFPIRDYSEAQKSWFSSCLIRYNYNFYEKEFKNSVVYDNDEGALERRYGKQLRKEFDTFLTSSTNASNLGIKLSGRFSILRETVQVAVGQDTSNINLLDTVNLKLNINGRIFSSYERWVVKEIDTAQDILTMEPVV